MKNDRKRKEPEIVGIACYRSEDWARLREISEDADDLEESWQEWKTANDRFLRDCLSRGFVCYEVQVDLDELIAFCRQRRIPVNGDFRAMFAAEKIRTKFAG
jgi:hypothetical protein